MPHQLRRVAKRAALGIARTGTYGGNGSGDIFLAFSTANPDGAALPHLGENPSRQAQLRMDYLHDDFTDVLYEAAVQAVEEAVLNALFAADSMVSVKPRGLLVPALDQQALAEQLAKWRALGPGEKARL